MLANEMKWAFLVKYDKITNLVSPGYDDREISYILNEGQDRVFKSLYNPLGNKYQQGFEFNEQRRRDLAELVRTVHIIGAIKGGVGILPVTSKTNGYTCTISEDLAGNFKVVTILTNNANTNIPTSSLTTLPLVRGLAKGTKIVFNGDDVQDPTSWVTVTDILSDNKFLIDTDKEGKLSFIGGLAMSYNQSEAHRNSFAALSTQQSKGYLFDLPELFLYCIEEMVITTEEPRTYAKIKPITHDYYAANIRNPFKQPYKNLVWRMDIDRSMKGYGMENNGVDGNIVMYEPTSKRVELITNGSSIIDYYLRYISYPRRIVVDEDTPSNQISCELDESIHNMILDEAVKFATGITNPNEYQIKIAEKQSSE